MSLRNVRSPEAPKITTLQGCGMGRDERPSRKGLTVEAEFGGFKAPPLYVSKDAREGKKARSNPGQLLHARADEREPGEGRRAQFVVVGGIRAARLREDLALDRLDVAVDEQDVAF